MKIANWRVRGSKACEDFKKEHNGSSSTTNFREALPFREHHWANNPFYLAELYLPNSLPFSASAE